MTHGNLKKINPWWILVQLAQNVWNSCLKIFPVIFTLFGEDQDHIISLAWISTQPESSFWPKPACRGLRVWLSCFLPKPLDFSMRHGVQNVVPAWGPLMIWVFFFLQQQEDCCSVIKMNSLDHQCIFKCSVTRLKLKRKKKCFY